jgi:hypothetical protein
MFLLPIAAKSRCQQQIGGIAVGAEVGSSSICSFAGSTAITGFQIVFEDFGYD